MIKLEDKILLYHGSFTKVTEIDLAKCRKFSVYIITCIQNAVRLFYRLVEGRTGLSQRDFQRNPLNWAASAFMLPDLRQFSQNSH